MNLSCLMKDIILPLALRPIRTTEFSVMLRQVARGADQAFRTKVELVNYKKVMQHLQKQFEEVEANLSVFTAMLFDLPSPDESTNVANRKLSSRFAQELDQCRGCLHAVRETRRWTAAICKTSRFPSTNRMFIAGDGFVSKVPKEMDSGDGLNRRLEAFREMVTKYEGKMKEIITEHGWPPKYTYISEGKHICNHCQKPFGPKWIRLGSCWRCRSALRQAGKCPYENGTACLPCPHSRRCLRCEQVSCSLCRVWRSTDFEEGIVSFVQKEMPDLIFVDFDQTLCETKNGS